MPKDKTPTKETEQPTDERQHLPVLPIRDIVVFPHMVVPLIVVRDRSVRALQESKQLRRPILLLTQRDAQVEEPTEDDLHAVGTIARCLQLLELPD
ncbi:MAG: LON peptidase substrate-binding domain-containing protein, partial [Armatimonadota bacterium]